MRADRALVFGVLLAGPLIAAEPRPDSPSEKSAPRRVGEFRLNDPAGQPHSPKEWADKKVVVLVFLAVDCPVSNHHVPDLNKLAESGRERGVALCGVYPLPSLKPSEASDHAREFGLKFPVLLDPEQVLVAAVGATRTPEVAVLTPSGELVYLGRIDDRYAPNGKRRDEPRTRELQDAVEAVLAGRAPPTATAPAYGCPIPKLRR